MTNMRQLYKKIFKKNRLILSKKELKLLCKYPGLCEKYSEQCGYENIPEKIINSIVNFWTSSYCSYYIEGMLRLNKPLINCDKLLAKIAKSSYISTQYIIKKLNYENIPGALLDNLKPSLLRDPKIYECFLKHSRKKKLAKLLA